MVVDMLFMTETSWEEKNPVYKLLDDPENPMLLWRAVEVQLEVYYYHVHVVLDYEEDSVYRHLLISDFEDALKLLLEHPRSTLDVQVPKYFNRGRPGIFSVNNLFMTTENMIPIAECKNGKVLVLSINSDAKNINAKSVEKKIIWSKHVDTKYRI